MWNVYDRRAAIGHGLNGDSDEDDSDGGGGGMCGFTASECEELLCQGVKPWDSDAENVLMALNGDYDDFY